MDLAPGRSSAEWAVTHGHTVFAISYRQPRTRRSATSRSTTTCCRDPDRPRRRRRSHRAAAGEHRRPLPRGTLTAMLLAYLADAERRPSSLGHAAEHARRLRRAGPARRLRRFRVDCRGSSGGWRAAATSTLPRWRAPSISSARTTLIWNYVASNWLMGEQPPAFDILASNSDSTCLPAAMHSFYLRSCYVENAARAEQRARRVPAAATRGRNRRHLCARGEGRPHRPLGLEAVPDDLSYCAPARSASSAQLCRPRRGNRQSAESKVAPLDARRAPAGSGRLGWRAPQSTRARGGTTGPRGSRARAGERRSPPPLGSRASYPDARGRTGQPTCTTRVRQRKRSASTCVLYLTESIFTDLEDPLCLPPPQDDAIQTTAEHILRRRSPEPGGDRQRPSAVWSEGRRQGRAASCPAYAGRQRTADARRRASPGRATEFA